MNEFYELLGKLILYFSGSTAVAYTAFHWLGAKWIENKFSRTLDNLRHQQAIEVQRLRIEIDSLLSGRLKIQEREFLVLPEVWEKLNEAYSLVSWLVSPIQEYANISAMTADQLEEFLSETDLQSTEKQAIRNASDKSKRYQEIIFWHRLHTVKSGIQKLQQCIAKNGIFFPPELEEKLDKLSDHLWSAVTGKEIGREAQDPSMEIDSWRETKEQTKKVYEETKSYIQHRLLSHAKSN